MTVAAPASGPPTYVQSCESATWSTVGEGASCVIPSAGAGDVLLIGVISFGANPTVKVNGVPVTVPLDTAKAGSVATFIYPNIASGNTPVVVQTTDTGVSRLVVSEFSNVGSNPLDGHAVGSCDSGCVFGAPINTPAFTVSGNDAVWAWCGNDFAGEGAGVGTMPANDYVLVSTAAVGTDWVAEYRVQMAAGSTYAQCQVSTGFIAAIAIKGK